MIGVAQRLQEVRDVRHTIYTDDITLWVTKGSDGHIEDLLQEAVLAIEGSPQGVGTCVLSSEIRAVTYPPQEGTEAEKRRTDYGGTTKYHDPNQRGTQDTGG